MKQRELSRWVKLIIVFCALLGLLFFIYVGPQIEKDVLLDLVRKASEIKQDNNWGV